MTVRKSFDYCARADAKVLILGSMPGEESLRQQQYYAHPRNSFWDIMGALFGAGRDLPYRRRLEQLTDHRIALWDVAHVCRRHGSLDSNIELPSVEPNNFAALFKRCPGITTIFFNGNKAAELFRKLILPKFAEKHPVLEYVTLPSTSPANASLSPARKLHRWREIQKALTI